MIDRRTLPWLCLRELMFVDSLWIRFRVRIRCIRELMFVDSLWILSLEGKYIRVARLTNLGLGVRG